MKQTVLALVLVLAACGGATSSVTEDEPDSAEPERPSGHAEYRTFAHSATGETAEGSLSATCPSWLDAT